jgi:hypothetical protein
MIAPKLETEASIVPETPAFQMVECMSDDGLESHSADIQEWFAIQTWEVHG